MITKTFGAAIYGVEAQIITIEVNIVQGTNLYIVGLPDNSIKESQHRIESALKSMNFMMPRQKVIVNLAPADIHKEGSSYDLPIALAILHASRQCSFTNLETYMILGELSLDGLVRPIKGILPMAIEAKKRGIKTLLLPYENSQEAAIVDGIDIIPIKSISEAILLLLDKTHIDPVKIDISDIINKPLGEYDLDFSDVHGQENVKRALEISAAGGHNAIMIGTPGAGKTMLTKRLATILPPMTISEALETTKIYSVSGKLTTEQLIKTRPFRAPHHTISHIALVGGGINPRPGEISLAHNGVLFLDELPEFSRATLEVLRQPLEERKITISRAKVSVDFPANFMLIASMNPCPCGYYNHPTKQCTCPHGAVQKYLSRVSGPLFDRIDIHIQVNPVLYDDITNKKPGERSEEIRKRVTQARQRQIERFTRLKIPDIYTNAMMSSNVVKKVCPISDTANLLIKKTMERLGLSARAYDKILKVSRTIADLDNSESILDDHVAEAIKYRSLDRSSWGLV